MPDNKLTHPTLVKEAVERIKRDIADEESTLRNPQYVTTHLESVRTLLAALPTDDDVERVARGMVVVYNAHAGSTAHDVSDVDRDAARAAIHTLIGRDR